MEELMNNEAFCIGVNVGINLYQRRVINAHNRKEPLKIGEDIFYLETGRERLERVLGEICK